MESEELGKYHNNIVCVEWLDACCKQRTDITNLIDPCHELVVTKTYGKLQDYDTQAIRVLSEGSSDEGDYSVIPISLITYITILVEKEDENEGK